MRTLGEFFFVGWAVARVGRAGAVLTIVLLIMLTKYKRGGRSGGSLVVISISGDCPGGRLVLRSFVSMRCITLRAASRFLARNLIRSIKGRCVLTAGEGGSKSVFVFSEGANGKIEGVGHQKRKTRRCTEVGRVVLSRGGNRVFMGSPKGGVLICSLCKGFGQYLDLSQRISSVFSCSGSGLVYCSVSSCRDGKRSEAGSCRVVLSGRSKDVAHSVFVPFGAVSAPVIGSKSEFVTGCSCRVHLDGKGYALVSASTSALCGCTSSNALDPFIMEAPSTRAVRPRIFLCVNVRASHCCFVRTIGGMFGFRGNGKFCTSRLICSGRRGTMFRIAVCGSSCISGEAITVATGPVGHRVRSIADLGTTQLIRVCEGSRLGSNGLGRVTSELGRRSGPIVVLMGRGGWGMRIATCLVGRANRPPPTTK